jgi:hemerythrin-like domain-containing protein
MQAIDTLRREHEVIVKVLAALERAAEAARPDSARGRGGPGWPGSSQSAEKVHRELFLKALEFVTGFVQRLHQAREEVLLRRLAGHEVPAADEREHGEIGEFAAACLRALPDAARGDPASRRMLAENAKAYVGILRSHIAREEDDLFDAATRALSEDDDREITAAFGRIERELGEGEPGRYEKLAGEVGELAKAIRT